MKVTTFPGIIELKLTVSGEIIFGDSYLAK